MIPATMLWQDVKVLFCEHCFESLGAVRYRGRACPCLHATMGSLSQAL